MGPLFTARALLFSFFRQNSNVLWHTSENTTRTVLSVFPPIDDARFSVVICCARFESVGIDYAGSRSLHWDRRAWERSVFSRRGEPLVYVYTSVPPASRLCLPMAITINLIR